MKEFHLCNYSFCLSGNISAGHFIFNPLTIRIAVKGPFVPSFQQWVLLCDVCPCVWPQHVMQANRAQNGGWGVEMGISIQLCISPVRVHHLWAFRARKGPAPPFQPCGNWAVFLHPVSSSLSLLKPSKCNNASASATLSTTLASCNSPLLPPAQLDFLSLCFVKLEFLPKQKSIGIKRCCYRCTTSMRSCKTSPTVRGSHQLLCPTGLGWASLPVWALQ